MFWYDLAYVFCLLYVMLYLGFRVTLAAYTRSEKCATAGTQQSQFLNFSDLNPKNNLTEHICVITSYKLCHVCVLEQEYTVVYAFSR